MFVPPPFHENRPSLVAPVPWDPAGVTGPTRGQARGAKWRTTTRGLFVPADVVATPEQRIVEAAAVLRDGEAVTGWAALRWRGGVWFDGLLDGVQPRPVPVAANRHLIARSGFSVSQEFLHPNEIEVLDGVPVTSAVRSVVFEMRLATGLGEAVVAVDMACYSDLVSLAEVSRHLESLGPVTGIPRAREAVAQGDENSWSPRETGMRGVWTRRAGLARPLCNTPLFTLAGRHIGTSDVLDDGLGLPGEYNGSDHIDVAGVLRDVNRDAAYREHGLEPVTMLAPDWNDLDGFVRRLHAARDRARTRTAAPGWTVVPPRWWTPTVTVEQRRALNPSQRARLLRYRRTVA